jgi:hypothetical protein
MAEIVLAGLGLAVCCALLLHHWLPERQRDRVDQALRRSGLWLRSIGHRRPWRRTPRKVRSAAEHEAHEAIQRARRKAADVGRQGNVYRPRAFKGQQDADDADA